MVRRFLPSKATTEVSYQYLDGILTLILEVKETSKIHSISRDDRGIMIFVSKLTYRDFLKTLPEAVIPQLPPSLQGIKVRQPWRWLIQFHYGAPRLHYEVSRPRNVPGLELGFHCEARDKDLNRYLLYGFRKNLFEIKDTLGESMEAEMWDKGWTKIYEVFPEDDLTPAYQAEVGGRLAEIIVCLHPIYVQLRNDVARVHR